MLDIEWCRGKMALVSQEPVIYIQEPSPTTLSLGSLMHQKMRWLRQLGLQMPMNSLRKYSVFLNYFILYAEKTEKQSRTKSISLYTDV